MGYLPPTETASSPVTFEYQNSISFPSNTLFVSLEAILLDDTSTSSTNRVSSEPVDFHLASNQSYGKISASAA
jgi:hypothetical protein